MINIEQSSEFSVNPSIIRPQDTVRAEAETRHNSISAAVSNVAVRSASEIYIVPYSGSEDPIEFLPHTRNISTAWDNRPA